MESILQKQLKKQQPFDSLEQEAYLNLLRTHNMLSAAPNRLLKQNALSSAQYNILRILEGNLAEGLPCLEIVSQMVTRVPDITRLVDRLEEAGLVTRNRSLEDRRVVLIALTDKGKLLIGSMHDPLNQIHQDTLGHLSHEELTELNRLLVKSREKAEAAHSNSGG